MSEDDKTGPYFASRALWEKLKPAARDMRQNPTAAEDALWQRLRNRQVMDAKFRRQHAIEQFIVDFVCMEARLIIEVDGAIHDKQQEEDAKRDAILNASGFRVLRFSNEQVLSDIDVVLSAIAEALASTRSE